MRNKPLELSLYVAGAGAFGVFLRWMENQLAFDERGLAEPSAFHFLMAAFLIACVLVFRHFLLEIERKSYYVPQPFEKALFSEVKLHSVLSFAAGGLMSLGALLLFVKSETDQFVGMLRLLASLALLAGIAYPFVLKEARRERPRTALASLMMLLPMLCYAVWLIYSYRKNSMNSVPLAYGMDMLTAILAMAAYFYLAGFAFGGPQPRRALLLAMLSGSVCLMSLADERYMGMELILLASAGQLLLLIWILLQNLERRERKVVAKKDDGFEHL